MFLRILNISLIAATMAGAVVLFNVKYEVADYRAKVKFLENQLIAEGEAINDLKAEWSYLNRPERLKELATRYLQLEPVHVQQIVTMNDLPGRTRNFSPDLPLPLGGYAGIGSPSSRIQ